MNEQHYLGGERWRVGRAMRANSASTQATTPEDKEDSQYPPCESSACLVSKIKNHESICKLQYYKLEFLKIKPNGVFKFSLIIKR